MRYDLARLGEQEFEDLSQALALCLLGDGVKVFGLGPDGGREAEFEGNFKYPDPSSEGSWSGYGILQAKYKYNSADTGRNVPWLKKVIKDELDRWSLRASGLSKGATRKYLKIPDYIIFATNVELSGIPERGGIDVIDELISDYADRLGLKGWRVWNYEQICRHLDGHPEIRQTYAALVTPGDILAKLQEVLTNTEPSLATILTSHAAKELVANRWVRLDEAGHPTNQKLLLSSIAVDLPARGEPHPNIALKETLDKVAGVAREIMLRGDTVRRLSSFRQIKPHVVLIGGPGQGKSTICELLCHAYRVALLERRPLGSLGPEAGPALAQIREDLEAINFPTPASIRWPIKVTLSRYGDALTDKANLSLLRYIAKIVSARTPIQPRQLKSWLRSWPWLLIFDGLDEVASPVVRERLMSSISDFFVEAAEVDADLLIVATTRPQGYGEEFSPSIYQHFELTSLEKEEALEYGKRLARVRYAGDPDLHTQVLKRLDAAVSEPITARLMRTPLQVTIMSLLLERRTRVPQDRHGLFEAYYKTIYERVISKETPTSNLLVEQRRNIDYLHERVGWLLQLRAEQAGDAESLFPLSELNDLALARLRSEEYGEANAMGLAAELVAAATDRLVLLVPRTAGHVGFEVRSLQELMAARLLSKGNDRDIVRRLEVLASSAHWRNTWLFAVSRLFSQSEREHLRTHIVTLLAQLDVATGIQRFITPGARLAVEMLDEDIAAGMPLYRKLLVERALKLLAAFPSKETRRLGEVLFHTVADDESTRGIAESDIDIALSGNGNAALVATQILSEWTGMYGPIASKAGTRLNRSASKRTSEMEMALAIYERTYPSARRITSYGPATVPSPDLLSAKEFARDLAPYVAREKVGEDVTEILHILNSGRFEELDNRSLDENVQNALVDLKNNIPVIRWYQGARMCELLTNWYERQPIVVSDLPNI
jgi:hypothetical protein